MKIQKKNYFFLGGGGGWGLGGGDCCILHGHVRVMELHQANLPLPAPVI